MNLRRKPEDPVLLSVKKTNSEFLQEDHPAQIKDVNRKPKCPQSYSVDNLLREHSRKLRYTNRHTERQTDKFENFFFEPIELVVADSGYGPESSVDDENDDDRSQSQCYPESFKIKDSITLNKNILRSKSQKSSECFHSDVDSGAQYS